MKLFFAAPLSGLPSDPTALGAHASRLHFAMKLIAVAPTVTHHPFLLNDCPDHQCGPEHKQHQVDQPKRDRLAADDAVPAIIVVSSFSLLRSHRASSRERQPCSRSHFCMKEFFAAPRSGLPSEPTAFGAHACARFWEDCSRAGIASTLSTKARWSPRGRRGHRPRWQLVDQLGKLVLNNLAQFVADCLDDGDLIEMLAYLPQVVRRQHVPFDVVASISSRFPWGFHCPQ
jgi:hypothetical protein